MTNGFDIIRKFISSGAKYADYGYIYEPHDSIKIHVDDKEFLVLDSYDFVNSLNEWLAESSHREILVEETGYDLPEDKNEWKYFDRWLDYLTGDMWGYSDEYGICDCCNEVIQTYDSIGPKHNHWIAPWAELICEDCLLESEELKGDYLKELTNEPTKCNLLLPEDYLEEQGFEKDYHHYENGWYGQVDDPKEIYKKIKRDYPNAEVVFNLDDSNPFAVYFSVFIKYNIEELEEAM